MLFYEPNAYGTYTTTAQSYNYIFYQKKETYFYKNHRIIRVKTVIFG